MIVGGLYTGGTTYQTDERLAFLKDTWTQIGDLSGQEFDFSILDKKGGLYDTELACRAVVAMRRVQHDKIFEYFELLQKNFYAKGWDGQEEATYLKAAISLGLDGEVFMKDFRSDECIAETRGDFALVKQIGIGGFPTVLLRDEEGELSLLTSGYQPLKAVEGRLKLYLHEGA